MAREQRWASNSQEARAREERALATERDRIVRNNSVANDIRLNLPVSVTLPDGEERFQKSTPSLLPYDTRSEIQRSYIKAPPNRSVCCTPDWDDSNSPSPCSCGPVSQSVPKCGSSGQHGGGWSLSWSRSSKSPPAHSRHRCQRHSHPSNPSNNSRHSAGNSSGSKQKSSLGPQPSLGGFLVGASGSDKLHNTDILCKGHPTGPSITERLQGPLTEKVYHATRGSNSRTSPNNNGSMSSVLEPLFSSITSRDSKRNGKCKKSSRNEPSRTFSPPSETNRTAEEHLSDFLGGVSRGLATTTTRLPGSSSSNHESGRKSSGSEDGESSSDEKARVDNNNGNARVPPVIGRHGDKELVEQQSSFAGGSSGGGGLEPNFSEPDKGRGSYSKKLSSTTDSSLYHPNMHPNSFGSALSESIKETAHSELSETYTANQLSDQYCNAEIASTSSICSSGQSKDVRSLRDVT